MEGKGAVPDTLNYESWSIHGRIQFNANLAYHKLEVTKLCRHWLETGIMASKSFAHASFLCPEVQYNLHEIQK